MIGLPDLYQKEIRPKMQKELGMKNPFAVPRVVKMVVNIGMGEALQDKKKLESVKDQLATITGQQPVVTRAQRAISSFKLRKGDAIGLKVTLRGKRMYDFLKKLVSVVLPRMRDFRGVKDSFDEQGNITLGFSEQIIFPEIEYAKIDKVRGLEVTIVTSTKDKKKAKRLLELLGMPFRKSV